MLTFDEIGIKINFETSYGINDADPDYLNVFYIVNGFRCYPFILFISTTLINIFMLTRPNDRSYRYSRR